MSFRRSVLTAGAAVLLGALLLGGTATYAGWTTSTSSETTTLTAGSLTARITQNGPTAVPVGTMRGVYPRQGSVGLIPGVQGQRWSYTLSNAASSAVTADATLRLQGTPQNTTDYQALRPYLRATVQVSGQQNPITVPVDSFTTTGFTHEVDLGARLQPGQDLQITVTFSIPASAVDNPNLGVTLNSLRSNSTGAHSIFTMTNALYLRQVGDPT